MCTAVCLLQEQERERVSEREIERERTREEDIAHRKNGGNQICYPNLHEQILDVCSATDTLSLEKPSSRQSLQ